MEAYVTRKEFDNAMKELRRLQLFLTETFGNKFSDFQIEKKDKDGVSGSPQLGVVGGSGVGAGISSSVSQETLSGKPRDNISFGGGGDGSRTRNSISSRDEVIELDPLKIVEEEPSTPIIVASKSLSNKKSAGPIVLTRVINNSGLGKTPSPNPAVPRIHTNLTTLRATTPITLPLRQPVPATTPSLVVPVVGAPTYYSPSLRARLTENSENRSRGNHSGPWRGSELPELAPITDASTPLIDFIIDANNSSNKSSVEMETASVTSNIVNEAPRKKARREPLPSFRKRKEPPGSRETTSSSEPPSSSSPTEIIQCKHCQLFIYSSQLEEHTKNHSILDSKNPDQCENDIIFQQPQTCPMCKLDCVDFQTYEDHCRKHHTNNEIPCPICGKTMHLIARLRRHMLIHKNLKFTCDVCGKRYNRKDNLTAHSKIHSKPEDESTVFYCGVCKRNAFASREGRDRHMRTAHPNEIDDNLNGSEKITSMNTDKPVTTETIDCGGNGTANLLGFVYEGEDEEEDVINID